MDEDIRYLMAMSCLLPALAGIYRYSKIDKKYHPFIYMMMLDVAIETIYYLSVKFPQIGRLPWVMVNIYMYSNFFLFLYFVHINNYLAKNPMRWLLVIALLIALFNYIYLNSLFITFFYLLCFVSAVMLIISITILSRQILVTGYKLVNNCWFWISSFSILYNAFTLLIFGLYFFALSDTPNGKAIGSIQHFVNLACYIFFGVAIFKIPGKNNYAL